MPTAGSPPKWGPCSQFWLWYALEQESPPSAGFLANCLPPHLYTTSITTCTDHNHIYTTTTTTQCKLVYAQVVLGKRPPAQVAEGNHHKCRVSVCASCWNEKHHQRKLLKVRGTGHQHPSAQVGAGAATMQLAHGHNYDACSVHVQVACCCCTRSNLRRWMLVPGPPDLQQLALVVFFIPATSTNTHPALVVVTLCNLRWWPFS